MLGFPLPYPDELIYSTIARYGIHSGLTSPKELLQEVFGKNTVIATSDLHGHLEQVAELYPGQLNVQPESLLYKHTLFPLYALFIGESRRTELKKQLLANKVHSYMSCQDSPHPESLNLTTYDIALSALNSNGINLASVSGDETGKSRVWITALFMEN